MPPDALKGSIFRDINPLGLNGIKWLATPLVCIDGFLATCNSHRSVTQSVLFFDKRTSRGQRGSLGALAGNVNFTKVIFGVGSRSPQTSALPLW